jgi:phosphatidylserine decarboxylase
MIAKDGWPIIRITAVFFLIFLVLSTFFTNVFLIALTSLIGVLLLFHFFFFRDPQREIPQNQYAVLSPADGRVVSVEQVEEKEYFKEKVWKISIFLSVFNVHVNRMPVSGKIEYLRYKKGQFLAAFAARASELNEQSVIGIQNINGKVLFKQIAGLIARRIIYRCNDGDEVNAGERFGLIRYGSRVDVFLPLSANILISRMQRVKGGSSVLGEFSK